MSRPLDLLVFACECCGETKLVPEMITRLENQYEKLGADPPRVAAGYRCPERAKIGIWNSDPAHTEGRSVTFHSASQNYRHVLLKACLECFDYVFIYPTRITVHVGTSPTPPCCWVM